GNSDRFGRGPRRGSWTARGRDDRRKGDQAMTKPDEEGQPQEGTLTGHPVILMCPPDYYGIEYEINPWMSRSRGASPERSHRQWHALYETLLDLGVRVELMTPQKGLPDLVFTANAGLVFGQRFFSSRFRHEVRARETPYFDAWFAEHGFTVEHLP